MTRARFDTRPSLTPKMTARRVPERPLRCHRSPFVIASGLSASPTTTAGWVAADTTSVAAVRRAGLRLPLAASSSSRFQISRCSRSSAAIASIAGCASWSP